MKTTLAFLMLSLLLTACSRENATDTKQILGAWPSHNSNGTRTTTYNPDGSFTIVTQKPSGSESDAGTWEIRGGFLTMTFTNSSVTNHNSPVGMSERYHIIYLDSHKLQMEPVVTIVTTLTR